MPTPTKIKVNLGTTANIGNYESVRLDYAITAELKLGEKSDEALHKLRKYIRKELMIGIAEEIKIMRD